MCNIFMSNQELQGFTQVQGEIRQMLTTVKNVMEEWMNGMRNVQGERKKILKSANVVLMKHREKRLLKVGEGWGAAMFKVEFLNTDREN